MFWHVPELIDVLMVLGLTYCLRCCWHCRVFWFIQAFQLLEVADIYVHYYAFERIFAWDYVNLGVSILACACAIRHFRPVAWLMLLLLILKAAEWKDVDVAFQLQHNALFWTRFAVNELILLILFWYGCRKVISHHRSNNAKPKRSSRSSRRSRKTSTSTTEQAG